MFDGYKFFGYMTPELCTLLLDISEFGLVKPHSSTETPGLPVGPRFYMKYLSEIWFVLFVPGCRDGITGYSPEIPDIEDLDEDEDSYEEQEAEGIAREKALAEDYDAKLLAKLLTKTLKYLNLTAQWRKCAAPWKAESVEDELDKAKVNSAGIEGEFTAAEVKGTLKDEVVVEESSRVCRPRLGLRNATKWSPVISNSKSIAWRRGSVTIPTFLNLNFLSPQGPGIPPH
ncbi:uncharacterized protein LACBIDRAFT_333302 [Laccaria bicolor S238N-H82]|uniref:Predicted protein n=1 Tax=Laccaria bicolor (strain S238N-H82 / ATCC MYA-4686) TaxID=486041 RepID=B0DVI4_LACBS|nr:uncharacterized protein LACBIDRAFT_333302 [Laccaria bicolor S238N-H82]EDR01393.1 predicted protein [Laccaria bicolor S238N-H82]|eukprot:XP_001887938.1 predicted protein [Laccaria bicolor S238N-H82]